MAIVFDSDAGTITGLSVGGLPDGIVDAGTLASNAVDSAELVDGAIDAAHLASGVGGKVIGYQYTTDTTNRSGTAGSEAVTGITFAYTPSAATSRLLICMNVPTLTLGVTVSAIRVKFRVRTTDGTGGTELLSSGFGSYQSGGTLVHEFDSLQTYTFIHHPNSTSEQDYCLTVENASGAPTWKVSGCDNSWITGISILEIDGS